MDSYTTLTAPLLAPARPRPRRARTLFPPPVVAALEAAFAVDPYPDVHCRDRLSDQLGYSEATVHTWFQNKRSRHKRGIRPKPRSPLSPHKASPAPSTSPDTPGPAPPSPAPAHGSAPPRPVPSPRPPSPPRRARPVARVRPEPGEKRPRPGDSDDDDTCTAPKKPKLFRPFSPKVLSPDHTTQWGLPPRGEDASLMNHMMASWIYNPMMTQRMMTSPILPPMITPSSAMMTSQSPVMSRSIMESFAPVYSSVDGQFFLQPMFPLQTPVVQSSPFTRDVMRDVTMCDVIGRSRYYQSSPLAGSSAPATPSRPAAASAPSPRHDAHPVTASARSSRRLSRDDSDRHRPAPASRETIRQELTFSGEKTYVTDDAIDHVTDEDTNDVNVCD